MNNMKYKKPSTLDYLLQTNTKNPRTMTAPGFTLFYMNLLNYLKEDLKPALSASSELEKHFSPTSSPITVSS
jgi:hypothetical protein